MSPGTSEGREREREREREGGKEEERDNMGHRLMGKLERGNTCKLKSRAESERKRLHG